MVAVAAARLTALALSWALYAASIASAQVPPSSGPVVGSSLAFYLVRARGLALKKLSEPDCRLLFDEFRDLAGRPLSETLNNRGETAEVHLGRMAFRDGSDGCDRPGLFAFTSPGSLTVFVCPSFREIERHTPNSAANLLIHEELHSLGAGEAPSPGLPTSQEITRRVAQRCGA